MPDPRDFRLDRRAVLGLAALGLAACSAPQQPGPSQATAGAHPATPSAATSGSATSPSTPTTPAPTVQRPPLPSREQVLESLVSRRPQAFGLDVPGVVSRLSAGSSAVALTFDACGGSGGGDGVDTALIDLLRRLDVPATLFLNTRWIAANDSYARELAKDPLFELANHGHRHLPLTVDGRAAYGIKGTHSLGEAYDEVEAAVQWFVTHAGAPPRWFRSGTAHVDDVCAQMARLVGQPIAGFSVNGDAGATFSAEQVRSTVSGVAAGDIVISHMNRPRSGTGKGYAAVLPKLLDRGVRFTRLSEGMA